MPENSGVLSEHREHARQRNAVLSAWQPIFECRAAATDLSTKDPQVVRARRGLTNVGREENRIGLPLTLDVHRGARVLDAISAVSFL